MRELRTALRMTAAGAVLTFALPARLTATGGTNNTTHTFGDAMNHHRRMVDDLGNARLFTYVSDGHGAINDGNPCVVVPVIQYLTDPTQLPAEGASCEQTTEPFGD
jgi:hypothetical protein